MLDQFSALIDASHYSTTRFGNVIFDDLPEDVGEVFMELSSKQQMTYDNLVFVMYTLTDTHDHFDNTSVEAVKDWLKECHDKWDSEATEVLFYALSLMEPEEVGQIAARDLFDKVGEEYDPMSEAIAACLMRRIEEGATTQEVREQGVGLVEYLSA